MGTRVNATTLCKWGHCGKKRAARGELRKAKAKEEKNRGDLHEVFQAFSDGGPHPAMLAADNAELPPSQPLRRARTLPQDRRRRLSHDSDFDDRSKQSRLRRSAADHQGLGKCRLWLPARSGSHEKRHLRTCKPWSYWWTWSGHKEGYDRVSIFFFKQKTAYEM